MYNESIYFYISKSHLLMQPLSNLNEAALARLLAGRGNPSEFVGLSKKQIAELCKWVDEERSLREELANYYQTLGKTKELPRYIGMACRAWKGTQYMRSVEKKKRDEEERLKRQAEAARLKRQAEEEHLKCQAEKDSILLHLRLLRNVDSSESDWVAQLFALPDPEDFRTLHEIMSSASSEEDEF